MASTTVPARYRFIAPLGAGGMATVVLAEDTVLGRQVALKRMTAIGDARGLSRLRREALVGASVSHPNLVSVFDVIADEDGDVIIVMEYVRGETLRDGLKRQGKLAVPDALRILAGVAAGLDTIHAQGIVHRDVKPANILLGEDGSVKVADLGIAVVSDRTRITTAGAVLGTFSYMAPEQLEDATSKPAIDIYALAAVAYETLSGQKARAQPNPVALAHALATQPPPDLRDAWPSAPAEAAQLLIRAMARDPAARPRSAGEFISRLRAALEPEVTAPVASPRSPPRRVAAPERVMPTPVTPRRAAPDRVMPAQVMPKRVMPARVRPAPASPAQRRPARAVAVALLAVVLAGAVLAVVLNAANSSAPRPVRTHASHSTRTSSSTTTSAKAPAGGVGATTPASTAGVGPAAATTTFYGLAASHRYADAWALADPTFRSQVGGYQAFQSQQAGDISIHFDSARTLSQSSGSATVAVRTTSVRTDGTKHCSGTVDLVPGAGSGSWLLHLIHINCV